MTFTFHDIAGYNGKKVDVWVYNAHHLASTPETIRTDHKSQLRGAQGLDTTEELPEERVAELGHEATKAIYGPADYGASVTLLVRDLLQIARLAGKGSAADTRLVVSEFQAVNISAQYRDPDTDTVNFSKAILGFKSRTASKSNAAGGNSEITLEGSADLIVSADGQLEIVQHVGDGTAVDFYAPATVVEDDVVLVENPSGKIVPAADYSVAVGIITFNTAPVDGSIVRIVHKDWQTSNIVS